MLKNKILILLLLIYTLHVTHCTYSFAQEKGYNSQERRDPFIALVTKDGRLLKLEIRRSDKIELEGIISDPQGLSYAIVNKEIVSIGDWIGEYQVYKIESEKVIFLKEVKELEVELEREEE